MRYLNGVYTQAINRRHQRTGHILQGRFKSVLVEKDSHLLEVARYVVLNPVRAKMVRSARDWPWSSHRAMSGQAPAPTFLSVAWMLSQFDSEPGRAARAYRRFVQQGRSASIWDEGRTSPFLGSDAFIEKIRPLLEQGKWNVEIPRSDRLATRPGLQALFADAHNKQTRNEMIYFATRVHEYTLREVSGFLGMHYSTISDIGRRAAESRKTPK
jgi:putative transposase